MKRTYTPEMAVDLRVPAQPRLSPDGRYVAFSVNPIGHREKDATSTIFIAPTDGSSPPRPITGSEHNNTSPRWSPDGSTIAFLSDRPERGTAQLHVVPASGGEPLCLTRFEGGVAEPAWLPDGSAIAVTVRRRALAGEPDPKTDIKIASEKPRPRGLALIPPTGGPAREIGPRHGHVATYAFSPDGERIAACVMPSDLLDTAWDAVRLIVTRHDGQVERELITLSGFPSVPVWSPDGRSVAIIGSRVPNVDDSNTFVIDTFSNDTAVLDDPGTNPTWVAWDQDGLLVHSVHTQWTRFERTDPAGAEWDDVPLAEDLRTSWIESGLNIDARDGTLALSSARENRPYDIFSARDGEAAVRITDLNPQLRDIEFATMESLEWTANDGTVVHGWLMLPPTAKDATATNLPLVAAIHGGPSWQWGNWFHGTWHDWGQLLAAAGYAVLMPNPRGSTGKGGAFTNANQFDFGGGDFDDIMTGIDHLIARGVADPERLGICGWSYGGFMTAWAITHTDRFKAAVAGAAPTNWVSKIGTTDIRPFNEWNLGVVNTEPDRVWERSPIRYVAGVTTPTLIVHGEADVRVPVTQGTELYLALRALGVDTDMVAYPRQGHAFTERAHQLDLLQRLLGWFDKYLKT